MNNLLNIKTPAESVAQARKADYNLSNHGIGNLRLAYWNLPTEALYEEAIFRSEGVDAWPVVRSWRSPASTRHGPPTINSSSAHVRFGEQHLVGRVQPSV